MRSKCLKQIAPDAVSMSVLAAVTGMSIKQLTRLVQRGVLPRGKKPRTFDLASVMKALLQYTRDGREGSSSIADARLKLTEAQRRRVELEILHTEKQVVPITDVQRTVDAVMVIIAGQLDGLGGRLAGELATMSDPAAIRARVFDECRRIRAAAADRLEALAGPEAKRADSEASANAHR